MAAAPRRISRVEPGQIGPHPADWRRQGRRRPADGQDHPQPGRRRRAARRCCCTRTRRSSCSTSRRVWPCRAARASRAVSIRHAGGLAQPQGREAKAGASARPRHVGRAGRRAHAACCHEARRGVPGARDEEDLLGAGQGRAAQARGQDLDLADQGGDAGRRPRARRQAWREGRRPRRVLLPRARTGRPGR